MGDGTAVTDEPRVGVDRPWWRTTWPLTKRDGWQFAVAFAVVVGIGVALGFVLYRLTESNPIVRMDERVTDRFVDWRTDSRTTAATWGARVADTPVKIGLSALVVSAMLWRWRRWREALLVVTSLTFEASAYVVTSLIVGRPRPDVERLLESPVNTTFPSGHVAAATVYGAFVVIVFWHVRSRIVRALAVTACSVAVTVVGLARIYQGMHYLSDIVAGVVLGIVSLVVCTRVLGAPDDAVSTPFQPSTSTATSTKRDANVGVKRR